MAVVLLLNTRLRARGEAMKNNLFKIIKRDLKHFKSMAKCMKQTPKEELEFWEYIVAYSDNEIVRINKNENRI
jgi:hypothetical protein